MKIIDSPQPRPPEPCDELRQHLERYAWARQAAAVNDDLYAIVDELDGWLADERHYDRRMDRRHEWASLIDDLNAAWDLVGDHLRVLMSTMPELLSCLHPRLGLDPAARAALRVVLKQVRAEARSPSAPVAAFNDIVEAVRDPGIRSHVITGGVDVLHSILRLADRSLVAVTSNLTAVLNNDSFYVAVARHLLTVTGCPTRH